VLTPPATRHSPLAARHSPLAARHIFLLLLFSLLVQLFWAARLAQPAYMDAYYYANNGRRLAQGHGFSELVIWHYLDAPAGLPAPSHTYWRPLSSLLAALGYLVSPTFRGAQLPFVLLTSLLPLLSYAISRRLGGARRQAITAALFTIAGGYYAGVWNQPESFAPFAWAGGGCLLLLSPVPAAPRRERLRWLGVGLLAGLAHLARADGALLLLLGLLFAARGGPQGRRAALPALLALGGGYALIMGGWLLRDWLLVPRPFPPAVLQTIFLTGYDDLFAYGRTLGPAQFLAWGWDNIIRSRLAGLWVAAQTFVAVCGLIFLTPFILGAWRKRRAALRPLTLYAVLLFGAMSLLVPFPAGRGGLFHSTAALWPWVAALAAAGIDDAVAWTAARRAHWRPAQAQPRFAALFVALAFVLSFYLGWPQAARGAAEAAAYRAARELLPPDAVVMVGDAPAFHYHTGLPALSVPNEPLAILRLAAARYGVTHLLLDADHPRPLAGLYAGAPPASLRLIATLGPEERPFKLYAIQEPAP
jgi:hypothetical protein